MNPAKLGKLGFWAQVAPVSWVPERSEPNSKGFAPLATNLANSAKTWLLICFNEPSQPGLNPAIQGK